MNRKSIYILFIVLFLAAVVFIIMRYKGRQAEKENTRYTLIDRKGTLAQSPEWNHTKMQAYGFLSILDKNPGDEKASLGLASIFIREARISGNYVYYDMAAMKYVNNVLKKDSTNFEALLYKAVLYLSQHHFADGLALAQKAQRQNPYNAFVYGILVDGNVEMGYYDSAVANSDRMVGVRPDLSSYSRISYLREIYGDYPGAISAMKMAVDAGAPGDEGTEWTRTQLGQLYEKTGDLKSAAMHYAIAEEERPQYAYGLAGQARLAMAAKDYNTAIALYLQADSLVNDNAFKEELVDAYQLAGQADKGKKIAEEVIDKLSNDAKQGNSDESIGHYADRELAYAYLKVNDYEKALDHAMTEYNRRPDNIDVNETVAWVDYKKGDYGNALKYIKPALKTKCKNPVLMCRTGLIYFKNGDKANAKMYLQQGLANNPNINYQLKEESMKTLQTL